MYAKITALDNKLSSLNERFVVLETLLKSDAEKALSVVLLSKDLKHLQSSIDTKLTAARNEIDRVYSQNTLLLGLFATMAIGLLSLAVANWFQGRKIKKEDSISSE